MLHIPLRARVRNYLRKSFLRNVYHVYKHRGLEPNDVFLDGYGRSGSAWLGFMMSEVLWKVGRENSLGGKRQRFTPFLGHHAQAETRLPGGGRLIATHEPYRPDYQHAVCIVRDPRDTAVSTYYHVQRTMGLEGDFSDYLPLYLNGLLNGSGSWANHVKSWLDCPLWASGRAILVRYEDLQADTASHLRRVVEFVGCTPTDEDIAGGIQAGNFKVMRNREESSNNLLHRERGDKKIFAVRKGVVGDWKNHFTPADMEKFYVVNGQLMSRLGYSLEGTSPSPEIIASNEAIVPAPPPQAVSR